MEVELAIQIYIHGTNQKIYSIILLNFRIFLLSLPFTNIILNGTISRIYELFLKAYLLVIFNLQVRGLSMANGVQIVVRTAL